VIHAVSTAALSNAVLASFGCKAQVPIIGYRGTLGHISRWDPSAWLTYFNRRVTQVACNSDAVRGYLERVGVPRTRLMTLYKGHDVAWYECDARGARGEAGVPEGAFVVVCAATIRPVKGVDILVQAFELLHDLPQVWLLLVGENRDPQVALQLQRSPLRDRIRAIGFRADVARFIKASDLSVLVSREREGFPKSIVESMALGVPVLVSGVGGMVELVEDGVSGGVLHNITPTALAQKIRELVTDRVRRAQYAEAAQRRIKEHFSCAETVRTTIELYQAVLGQRGGAPAATTTEVSK
jgi:glycosyltransferase involved in cell wall biosynthesis